MRTRGWVGLLGVLLGLAALPASAQRIPVRFEPAAGDRALGGTYTFRWSDLERGALDLGNITSLTWYYSTRKDGTDLHRIVTRPGYQDDFSGFRARWSNVGPFGFNWILKEDPRSKRVFLPSREQPVSPLVGLTTPGIQDCVASVLLRPQMIGGRDPYGIQLRVQPGAKNAFYEVRIEGNLIKVYENGTLLCQGRDPVLLSPSQWYWLEAGVLTRKKTDVEIRVRIFDEKRQRVLASFFHVARPQHRELLNAGTVALFGPADFNQLYIDPWSARWMDDNKNELTWDASDIPSGEYYIVAEVAAEKGQPSLIFSDYTVKVRTTTTQALGKSD